MGPAAAAVVGLAAVDLLVAPLALPLGGEQLIIVAVVIVTLGGASLAAFLQDDIRHTTGYLVIADGAIVLLGLAALTPDAWGPARIWLVALAATKTGLATWAAVMESRFGSHRLPTSGAGSAARRSWARPCLSSRSRASGSPAGPRSRHA